MKINNKIPWGMAIGTLGGGKKMKRRHRRNCGCL